MIIVISLLSEDVIPELTEEEEFNLVIITRGHELLDETASYESLLVNQNRYDVEEREVLDYIERLKAEKLWLG